MHLTPLRRTIAALFVMFIVAGLAHAQDAPRGDAPDQARRPRLVRGGPASAPSSRASSATSRPSDHGAGGDDTVVSEHSINVDGQPLAYTATAGTIPLKDDSGKTKARMFFVAYEQHAPGATTAPTTGESTDAPAAATSPARDARPITFVFNGGPGAAAIWLHLGVAGPMRVNAPENGFPWAPPYRLEQNPRTWLAATDLVFIDPVGTGYSRPEEQPGGPGGGGGPTGGPQGGGAAREFYSVNGDIGSVADFIRIYLTKYNRWLSPKFVAGESYGTTRAAGLSEHLHDRYGIDLNGIVLMSTVLNFQTLQPQQGNDLPYPLYLPSYTAIAHYHKKLPDELQRRDLKDVVDEARQWSMNEYNAALLKGTSLSDQDRGRVEQQLSRYTGLPVEYVRRANLRIGPSRFEKELLGDKGLLIGRMDGRVTGRNLDQLNDTPEYDPSLTGYVGPFSSTFNAYARTQLKYESENVYEFLSPRVGPWDFGPAGNGYLNVATTLQRCLAKVPSLKVFIASGYYDLATPFTATDVTINQMPLDKQLRGNITHTYYEGGHMLYLNHPALEKLNGDLKQFFTSNAVSNNAH